MEWLYYSILLVVSIVLANVTHDLGHYFMAKRQNARGIFLEIGRGQQVWKNNGFSFHLNLFKTGRILYKKFPAHEEWRKLPVLAGGILGTAIFSVLLSIVGWIIPWQIGTFNCFALMGYVMQIHILYNIIPHQLFGKMSDGKRLYTTYKDLRTRFNFQFKR